MMDDFDRAWVDDVAQVKWLEAAYALIGLTRLGERPTTVKQLAAALEVPEDEAIKLAWRASRVRPQDGQLRLDMPWPGASPRRRLVIGDREMPVSGCAPDLFAVAAVLDVPFRADDTCPTTGTPIQVWFTPGGVKEAEPPEAVVVLLAPGQLGQLTEMEVEQINTDVCVQQPFFSSAQAAQGWLDGHHGGRVFTVTETTARPFLAYMRDTLAAPDPRQPR
jgi:hypothetical protein